VFLRLTKIGLGAIQDKVPIAKKASIFECEQPKFLETKLCTMLGSCNFIIDFFAFIDYEMFLVF
jgi:hypothetical protein